MYPAVSNGGGTHLTRLALTPQAKLHEEVAHTLTVSVAATIPAYPQLVPMASGIVPSNSLTEKENSGLIYGCFLVSARRTSISVTV